VIRRDRPILHRSFENILYFLLNDRVAVDVGLVRRWIDVEPNGHSEILRSVPTLFEMSPPWRSEA
jgi:hypothetical protein